MSKSDDKKQAASKETKAGAKEAAAQKKNVEDCAEAIVAEAYNLAEGKSSSIQYLMALADRHKHYTADQAKNSKPKK